MELRNTLGGGKTRKCGNAEGAGKRKCGRIVGRWMNGRVTERQMDGQKEGQTERRTDRQKEGRTDRKKDGQTERRTDRQNVLRRCERLGLSLCAVPSLNGTVCVFLFGRVGITERA